MPKRHAELYEAEAVEAYLRRRGFTHLRARSRAELITIESGSPPFPHARLRKDGADLWRLEMATHTGRWEKTPYRGVQEELLAVLVDEFAWVLEPTE